MTQSTEHAVGDHVRTKSRGIIPCYDPLMNIVIFSSSKDASVNDHRLARHLGAGIAQNGWTAVNGGGPGLMNALLQGAKEAGGATFAVQLARHHRQQSPFADQSISSPNLRQRQGLLVEQGQAFVALPGGLGTHYEIFEILSLKNAGELDAGVPLILLGDCYHDLVQHLSQLRARGYASPQSIDFFDLANDVDHCVSIIAAYQRSKSS